MDLHRGTVESIKRHLELDPSLYEETVDDEIKWKGRIFSADLLKVRLPGTMAGVAWLHFVRASFALCDSIAWHLVA